MRKELLDQKNWYKNQPVTMDTIKTNEQLLQKKLPTTYKNLMLQFNAGVLPKLCMFKVKDYPYPLSIDCFCSLEGGGRFYPDLDLKTYYSEIEYYYLSPPDQFPSELIIFGGEGCGDFICFDYRNNPNTDNPPIVYWKHDAEPGKDIFFVANSFDKFLDMLYPYSEK